MRLPTAAGVARRGREDVRGRKHLDSRCCEFDRKRQTVEPPADRRDRGTNGIEAEGRVRCARPLSEQHYCVVFGKRLDWILVLSAEAQSLAARDDDLQLRRRRKQPADVRCRAQHLLEVVKD